MLNLSENEIQRAVFDNFRQRRAPGVFAFHPKNGGIHQRGRRRGINAGLGVVSGVPDVIAVRRGQMFALELKSANGKPSAEQDKILGEMEHCGAVVGVANGLDAALAWLEQHQLLIGRAA